MYAHGDLDGNIFYIGEETGRRAWSMDRDRNWYRYVEKHLAGEYRVRILADDLSSASEPTPSDAAPLSWQAAIALLDTIPGIGRRAAEQILAENGPDMRRFPTAAHLGNWAKLSPGNNESAGKRHSGSIGQGIRLLRACLVQAAHAAVRVKDSYLRSFYHRMAARREPKRALVAVAHHILTAACYMLLRHEPYRDLNVSYLDERSKTKVLKRVTRRIEQLGYRITLEPMEVPALYRSADGRYFQIRCLIRSSPCRAARPRL